MFKTDTYHFLRFIYLFLERGEGKEKESGRETSVCGCLLCTPNWDLAHNPGVCPDWEWNWPPFGLQAGSQSTKPHQPGQNSHFYSSCSVNSGHAIILSYSDGQAQLGLKTMVYNSGSDKRKN